jgi:hypothetical protein
LDDLIVGSVEAESRAGKSYVIFGKTGSTAIELSAIDSGRGRFVINGENTADQISAAPLPLPIAERSIAVLSFLPKMT